MSEDKNTQTIEDIRTDVFVQLELHEKRLQELGKALKDITNSSSEKVNF